MSRLDLMLAHLEDLHLARDTQAADLHLRILALERELQAREPELMGQLQLARQELERIDEEFKAEAGPVEAAVREQIVQQGQTVKGRLLLCTYSERTTWDGQQLDRLADKYPDILACKRVTPVGSIRVNGAKS